MDSEHILISGTPEVLRGRVRVVRGQEQAASFGAISGNWRVRVFSLDILAQEESEILE